MNPCSHVIMQGLMPLSNVVDPMEESVKNYQFITEQVY